MRHILAALAGIGLLGAVGPVFAAMPGLSAFPKSRTLASCAAWAGIQGDDAIAMWGTQEVGGSSQDLAISRLTTTCLGDAAPEIVGFYSSAGAADAFCAKHKDAGICRLRDKHAAAEPADAGKPTWHGDKDLVEYGVEGTDDRSLRLVCKDRQLFALGPWDGGAGGKKRIAFEAAGTTESFPIATFEAGDGDNYEAKIDPHSALILGLLRAEDVTVRGRTPLKVPGQGSAALVRGLLAACLGPGGTISAPKTGADPLDGLRR